MFLATLEGVRNLEVFFHKIRFTGSQRKTCGGGDGDLACRVLLDHVSVGCMAEHTTRTRMVLPLLERCKIAGLNGVCLTQLVAGRERGNRKIQQVEWLVAEDKDNPRDEVLADVFENGVWIAEGKRVKVQRTMEDEEDEDEDEEDENEDEGGDEGEDEAEEEEDVNEATPDYGEELVEGDVDIDGKILAHTISAEGTDVGEEVEQPWFLAEQYMQSIDTQITTTNSTGAKYRASSVGGSSTSSGSAFGISDEGFLSSSSSSMSATGACKGRAGRSDDHHRSEMKSLIA